MGIRAAAVAGEKGGYNSLTLPECSSAMHVLYPARFSVPDPSLKEIRRVNGGRQKKRQALRTRGVRRNPKFRNSEYRFGIRTDNS